MSCSDAYFKENDILEYLSIFYLAIEDIYASPNMGGDILFLPRLSVRLSVHPSRNRVRSITCKPFKIFLWNFIEI